MDFVIENVYAVFAVKPVNSQLDLPPLAEVMLEHPEPT
jgi:hypothetical protein